MAAEIQVSPAGLVDAHVHVWSLYRGDYGWLKPEAGTLYRDFSLADYDADTGMTDGFTAILVQAAPTVIETAWLMSRMKDDKRIVGVIGWIDFDQPIDRAGLAAQIETGLVGVRPMLQDLPDAAAILAADKASVFEALSAAGVAFDGLVRAPQLSVIASLAAQYPGLSIVLDHCGKPPIATGEWQPWADDIAALAEYPNVACKLSGLVNEAGAHADTDRILPYVAHVAARFGEDRLIWGSDWPVVTIDGSFHAWHSLSARYSALLRLNPSKLFADNARRIYKLAPARTG